MQPKKVNYTKKNILKRVNNDIFQDCDQKFSKWGWCYGVGSTLENV